MPSRGSDTFALFEWLLVRQSIPEQMRFDISTVVLFGFASPYDVAVALHAKIHFRPSANRFDGNLR